jgi:predicted dehydrogenase
MANTDTEIRVGFIGAGANTRMMHLPRLQAIDNVTLVSVCNRSRASAEKIVEQFGLERVYDHWTDLIAAEDTNAVVIGTWPYLHCPATLAALGAGKHVLVEARMAMDEAEARSMLSASRCHPDLVAQIVPAPITFEWDATIARLIAEGYLGDLLAVEVRDAGLRSFIDRDAPVHWRQDPTLSGLNIMGLGIWYETLMRWVGPAKRITAMGENFVKMRRRQDGSMQATPIPDHLGVLGELVCGAQVNLQLSAVSGFGDGVATLYGSEATLQLRLAEGRLYGAARGSDGFTPIDVPDAERGAWMVEEEFVAAIRGEREATTTGFADGVRYMEFTEAVHLSMREARTVTLSTH